jgi:hypothetical protein
LDRPWSKIGADLFDNDRDNYLLLVDYNSNFFEVVKLSSTKTPSITKHCTNNFAKHGIPDILVSDNGPQFDNAEFKQFAKEWNFTQNVEFIPSKRQRSGVTHNPNLEQSSKESTRRWN